MATRIEMERQILDRLARIEGQVRGVSKMVEDGRDCESILTQVLAARTALERVAGEIVGTYIDECLENDDVQQSRGKIGRTVKLLTRLS
jgi:DNA-binding FrmR family transcriptional regulator